VGLPAARFRASSGFPERPRARQAWSQTPLPRRRDRDERCFRSLLFLTSHCSTLSPYHATSMVFEHPTTKCCQNRDDDQSTTVGRTRLLSRIGIPALHRSNNGKIAHITRKVCPEQEKPPASLLSIDNMNRELAQALRKSKSPPPRTLECDPAATKSKVVAPAVMPLAKPPPTLPPLPPRRVLSSSNKIDVDEDDDDDEEEQEQQPIAMPTPKPLPSFSKTRYPLPTDFARLPHFSISVSYNEPIKRSQGTCHFDKDFQVTFRDTVAVHEIPSYNAYDLQTRKRLWSSLKEIQANGRRNSLEFQSDRRHWKDGQRHKNRRRRRGGEEEDEEFHWTHCREEDSFVELNGELLHPFTFWTRRKAKKDKFKSSRRPRLFPARPLAPAKTKRSSCNSKRRKVHRGRGHSDQEKREHHHDELFSLNLCQWH
jgi:hypothetical protein